MTRCAASLALLSLYSPANVALASHAVPMVNSSHTVLPAVDSVMTRAMGKALDFAESAKEMQRRVNQRQTESKKHLERTKAKYEQSLISQAQEHQRLEDIGFRLNASILGVNKTNLAHLKDSEKLQKANAHLRKTLEIIQGKVTAAQDFLVESIRDTDDTGAEDLKVMEPTTPKPTLDQFLRVAISSQKDDLGGVEAPSLLQVSSNFRSRSHHGADPSDLVEVLAASLGDIAAAQKEGEAELKTSFVASFDVGQKRCEALDESNKKSNATLIAMEKVGVDLVRAKQHLAATHTDLQHRLVGLRKFAAKVDASSLEALSIPEKPTAPSKQSDAAAALSRIASQRLSHGSSTGGAHSLLAKSTQVQKPKAVAKKPVASASKPAGAKSAPAGAKTAAVQKTTAKPASLARGQTAGGVAVHAQHKLDLPTALEHATKAVAHATKAEMAARSQKESTTAGAGAKAKPLKKAPAAQASKATAAKAPGKTEATPLKEKPLKKAPAAQAGKATAAKTPSKTEAPAKQTAQHVTSKPAKAEKVPAQAATKTEDTKATWRSWLSSWR